MKIRKLKKDDLVNLVNLHYKVLPNEFLTSVSKSFLLSFYLNLFDSKHTTFLAFFTPARPARRRLAGTQGDPLQKEKLIGAIIGIEEKYKPTLKTYSKTAFLFLKNLPHFLLKPKKLFYLAQSFLFKIKSHQKTEIFFIGVSKSYQGKGLGKRLISTLEKEYQKKYSSLHVDCKCKLPSNFFYQKIGFTIKKTFTLYGEKWNRYKKNF